jgi:hypothetical protein
MIIKLMRETVLLMFLGMNILWAGEHETKLENIEVNFGPDGITRAIGVADLREENLNASQALKSPLIPYTANSFGKALSLNGNEQFFEIPDAAFLNIDKTIDLTLEFWFRANSSDQFNLVNKWKRRYTWTGGYQGWFANLNREPSYDLPFDHLTLGFPRPDWLYILNQFVKSNGSGGWNSTGVADFVATGTWHHFAIVFHSDSNNDNRGDITVYLDGKKRLDSIYKDDIAAPGVSLFIGGFPAAIDSTLDRSLYLNGSIDEVRIWSSARSGDEIRETMSDTLSKKYYQETIQTLKAYYRFETMENLSVNNDGLANDIRDLTVYQHHGNVLGGAQLTEGAMAVASDRNRLDVPENFELLCNYPNPFNASTTIRFHVSQSGFVSLKVYNLLGQNIKTLVNEFYHAGIYEVRWLPGADIPSGIYFCRFDARSSHVIKMLLQE